MKENIFKKANDRFEKFKKWWKNYFIIDFFDSVNLLLFITGTYLLVWMLQNSIIKIPDFATAEILFLTFIAILQYTKETYWLKQVQQKQLDHERTPIIVISKGNKGEYASFKIKNIGKGPAINVELRISSINKNGGFSNLMDLADDSMRHSLNLFAGEEISTEQFRERLREYTGPGGSNNIEDYVFAIIATYESVTRDPFYSMSLFKVMPLPSDKREYILKTTKFADYKKGSLSKVKPLDWLK